jgi:hypothetical protein
MRADRPDNRFVYLAYSEGCLTPCFDQHGSRTGEQAGAGIGPPSAGFGLNRSFGGRSAHLILFSHRNWRCLER